MFAVLLPDLPGFSVEQIERTEQGIHITARAMAANACCPDCQQASSRVHSYYTRRPMDLLSSGRPIWLALQVRGLLDHIRKSENWYWYAPSYMAWKRSLYNKGFKLVYEEGFGWSPFRRLSNSPLVPFATRLEHYAGLRKLVSLSPLIVFIAKKINDANAIVAKPSANREHKMWRDGSQ